MALFCFLTIKHDLVNDRFIKTYGTHIIVEMAIGGQDVICVKQNHSSTISTADLKLHMEDLGDFLFSDGKSHSPIHRKTKSKVPMLLPRVHVDVFLCIGNS